MLCCLMLLPFLPFSIWKCLVLVVIVSVIGTSWIGHLAQKSVLKTDVRSSYPFRHLEPRQPMKNVSFVKLHTCQPVKNVSFVKLHRVGSGTMHNVLVRFAINHCAFVAIANCKYFQVFPQQVSKKMLFPPPQYPSFTSYNMFIDHAVFSRRRSDKFLPPDVVYITQIRHPYTHSFSVFDHYSKRLYPIRAVAPNYEQLLRSVMIRNYERTLKLSNSCPHNKRFSVSRNFMALELGYKKQTHPNETEFLKHLHNINSQLHHVSILERLPESSVVLRRKLCWHTKDLLHIRMHQTNSGSQDRIYRITSPPSINSGILWIMCCMTFSLSAMKEKWLRKMKHLKMK